MLKNDGCWEKVWNRIEQVAASVNVTMVKPRTANIQRHRANAAANLGVDQNPSDYYKINVYYRFIEHVIGELESRFSDNHKGLIASQSLLPVHLPMLTESEVDAIHTYYGRFLSYPEKAKLVTEVAEWKKNYDSVTADERPKTASLALAECWPQTFPAIGKILTIFLTTLFGSVSCERSFSALRRLKLWTRSSVTEERLSGLAMLLIQRDTKYIPIPQDIYERKSNWRHLLHKKD